MWRPLRFGGLRRRGLHRMNLDILNNLRTNIPYIQDENKLLNNADNKNTENKLVVRCTKCNYGAGLHVCCDNCNKDFCKACSKWYTVVRLWYFPLHNTRIEGMCYLYKRQLGKVKHRKEKQRTCIRCMKNKKFKPLKSQIMNNRAMKLMTLWNERLPLALVLYIMEFVYTDTPRPTNRNARRRIRYILTSP